MRKPVEAGRASNFILFETGPSTPFAKKALRRQPFNLLFLKL
jgi:hypothetical protein